MNKETDEVVIIGAGGHAKVVISTLIESGLKVFGLLDDDKNKWGSKVLDIPIIGPLELVKTNNFKKAVIGIGDNFLRKKLVECFKNDCEWITVIHPHSYVHPSVKIGEGTVIFAGTIIQPDAEIGKHVIINTGATVDHDCKIGDYVHLAPGVHLAGNITIDEGTFIGIGSSVIPGRSIGKWSVVGAGGVVINDIPPSSKVAGVPVRPLNN
jgi:sugar O-acyltransferase (sialic acid O-acetyltransferase NeuD family)